MYESFFHFQQHPFSFAPDPRRYFAAEGIETARKNLVRCIERGEGVGLIIGGSGVGKTLLLQLLAREFQNRMACASLTSGRICSRRALLQAILFELGLPYRGMEEGELRLALVDYLSNGKQSPETLLILADEAHTLPWRLMDELRMITNLTSNGQSRVRLVLAGNAQLEERFASPKMDSLSQRVAARCYLEAFSKAETAEYIRAQLEIAGGDSTNLFSVEARDAAYQAADGIPRLINQICDHALILACLGGAAEVTAAAVEEAWADLQQLPLPWKDRALAGAAGPTGVVEFGGLDDFPEEPEHIPFRPRDLTGDDEGIETVERHLDEVDSQLAELDDEFRPAGTIGPEVELVFENPFNEQFAEEEIVFDRYANLGSDLFSSRPKVTDRTDRELTAMIGSLSAASEPPAAHETKAAVAPAASLAASPAAHSSSIGGTASGGAAGMPLASAGGLFKPSLAADASIASGSSVFEHEESEREPPILVVEDDLAAADEAASRPAPVRRVEYRQLFSRLRRGAGG